MSRAFEQPLYHGTVEMIPRIEVTRGRFKKDFGRGFYMALQPRQAVSMMHKKFAEAVKRSRGKVGSLGAKSALLNVLEVENLGMQCCLCTEKAVEVGVMTFGPVDWRMYE